MVWQTKHNGIDIIAFQQLAKIVICSTIFIFIVFVYDINCALEMTFIHVADGNYAAVFLNQKRKEITCSLPANADATDGDLFARGDFAGEPEGERGNDIR